MLCISACLAGIPCRMDGKSKPVPALRALWEAGEAVAVCPERLGGLTTPRVPSELRPDGRVINAGGADVTASFRLGAERALEICRENGCTAAVLKARSPSCGKGEVYDGTFTKTLRHGDGCFARVLLDAGVAVQTEEEFLRENQ